MNKIIYIDKSKIVNKDMYIKIKLYSMDQSVKMDRSRHSKSNEST